MKKWWVVTVRAGVLCVAVVAAALYTPVNGVDTSFDWLNGTITYERSAPFTGELTGSNLGLATAQQHNCTYQTVRVVTGFLQTQEGWVCIVSGKGFRFGIFNHYTPIIGFGNDTKMYKITGLSSEWLELIAGTNTMIVRYRYGSGLSFRISKDFTTHLTQVHTGGYTSYEFSDPNMSHAPKANNMSAMAITYVTGYSSNGRFIVWRSEEVGGYHYTIQDLWTGVARAFSSTASRDDTARQNIAVSNDGKYVAWALGHNFTVWRVDDTCGYELPMGATEEFDAAKRCPSRVVMVSPVIDLPPGGWQFPFGYEFSDDGGQLSFYRGVDTATYRYTLNSPGYTGSRLDYLALGDSYSSGEGDVGRVGSTNLKWYRKHTDVEERFDLGVPREKCHLGLRSYPYSFAYAMHLPRDDWDTVACSGATTSDIYTSIPSSAYLGQAKGGDDKTPRLHGYIDAEHLKSTALNEFIPGRNAQIEFVKKYKPKVITLTAGGNDVGFGDKIRSCVWPGTCEFAKQANRQKLKAELRDMYTDLMILYRTLYDASGGQAKIYVVGYPQFVNGAANATCHGTWDLNADERKMIHNSVEYFNNVIEQAAKRIGVKYIDIEDSLGNHKLCDSETPYVTGITGVFGSGGNELQESFHPNAMGHEAMNSAIKSALSNQSPLDYSWCTGSVDGQLCPDTAATIDTIPTPSNGYFEEGLPAVAVFQKRHMVPGQAAKNSLIEIGLDDYSGKPNTNFAVTLYSDPTDLGTVSVDSSGGLDTTITIPAEVPAGYHTLMLSGETYSGEPVEYYQMVLVTGTNPVDLDENNVLDSQQPCGPFMTVSGQDADLDGIDDACDLEVSEEPQLYRVRTGDPERTYGIEPERADYLYIERNTHASSITGVADDYDPDGDGWAIVGASKGTPYTTSSAPDTAPAANFIVNGEGATAKPYVYIRAGGYGCTSFTPTSLAKVQEGQMRTIKKVAYNTDQCRSEPPEHDVDGDGQPDDTQPLYTARNGDPNKGEDAARIYLYRNFHAAEAQLGVSDYTPSGTPAGNSGQPIQEWNLLASSKPNEYIPAFNKLVILEGSNGPLPTILTKKQNGQCIAYQPETTSIIKQTTQSSRYIKKLANLPAGVGCD